MVQLASKSSVFDGIGLGDQRTKDTGTRVQSEATKLVVVADTPYAMDVNDRCVRVDTVGGAIAVYLPSVAEAAGKIYTIAQVGTDAGDVTVTALNTDAVLAATVMTQIADYVCLYSDGFMWFILAELTT